METLQCPRCGSGNLDQLGLAEYRCPHCGTSFRLTHCDKEKDAIQKAVLDYYHEGHARNDARFYEYILHPEWKFFLLDNDGRLRIIERDEYYSWYDPDEVDPELKWETEFYSIDVTEHLAAVKLRLECQKVRYIDYFNMMKIDGKWWIVHKMSYGVQKGQD